MGVRGLVMGMLCTGAGLFSAPLAAGEAGAVALGAELFGQHCAACHGVTAAGDGPLAPLLTVPVPDLGGLAARNDGVFPMLEVVHTIDGRAGRAAHGGPMPVWGVVFAETPRFATDDHGALLEASGRIMALTLWLESIQR
ncbi:MAG: c-type cytochrome [Alkalilacustris sp.]